jgi:beta-lactam-binding protein with PASTA domain
MNKFGAYLKTKSFRNTLLLAIGSVITIVLIAFFSLGFYTNHGSGIPVPALKGMPVERAISILTDQGFRYQIDSVYREDATPGTVVEQDPDPETNVKENRVIYLTVVTRQAPLTTLPDIIDAQYISAEATLASFGLKVGDTTYRHDITRNVLEVRLSGQIIRAGTKLPKGSKLDLVLGDGAGENEQPIPDLVNQDLVAAKFIINNSGLTIGTITSQGAITDSANLIVIAQSPMKTDSATKVSIGTPINLTVIQGKK